VVDTRAALRPVDFDPFAPVANPEPALPLTEPQAEMWAAAAMGREASCSYNQCFAITFRGALRVESLRRALDQAVARHDALRAVIAPDGSGQRILPPFSVEIPLVDVSALGPEARRGEIDRLLERECQTPFDLAEGPLLRAFVVREAAESHRFVLTAHHIVCDGWSSSVLLSDLGRLYAADCVGIPAQLGPASSYPHYVAEQTESDHVSAAAEDEAYWVAQYPAGAPILDLPLERPRPATKTYRSGQEDLRIDSELYGAVKKTGAKAGATLFGTLLAAYEVLVYRLSNQADFVVGIPFAGQLLIENPALVAHCVNTVPLRAQLDPAATFSSHLRTVRQGLANAQDHSRLTFGRLLTRLRVPRDRSRTPLVAMTFNTDKIGAAFDFGELTIASVATPKSYSNFELSVNVVDSGSDMVVECTYNADLFDAETIRRWLSHYAVILDEVARRPDTTLAAVPLLTGVQREDALRRGNREIAFPKGAPLHERFERQAARTPEAAAVTFEGETLSYAELNRRANRLAYHLRDRGVARGDLVGLHVERSAHTVLGILGILKAGAAYLPLDPAYPRERIAFMVEDAKARVAVVDAALAGDVAALGLDAVVVESLPPGPDFNLDVGSDADDPAYVIYTSGSTGTPKGCPISHYNVTRLFEATDAWFGFNGDDVWTMFHSYAFDFSVWEIWGALLHGGRVVVVPHEVGRSPGAFLDLLIAERVTVLNQTPSAFRQLVQVDAEREARAQALRYVIFGGEALELQALRPWFDRYGDTRPLLVNMYGITETTVHVTYRPISTADLDAGLGSVIGVPIPDLRVYLLDPRGEPVPIGVPGEIYVGGGGVAGSYLNRPELSLQRFVDDRFAARPGARMYRSGDLARRLANGDLEYLGRMDDQVKIRGFRIELGEIEAAVAAQPGVRDVGVVVREDAPGDRRIVAYVVVDGDQATAVGSLRPALRARLPEYMVPAHFVALAALPLTPNGKLDRKALPPPDIQAAASAHRVAPRTPTESRIATIFADALGAGTPGVHDDFFDLGGHSLKAVQIVTAIRSAFGVDLAMRHLFEKPTVAGLAAMVDVLAVAAPPSAGGIAREEMEL
jgi:amino acid adenylation domain-containing protein